MNFKTISMSDCPYEDIRLNFIGNDSISVLSRNSDYLTSILDYSLDDIVSINSDNFTLNSKPYLRYILANSAKNFFKNYIMENDDEMKFHYEKEIEEADPTELSAMKKDCYNLTKTFNEEINNWKSRNADKFEDVVSIPSIAEFFVVPGGIKVSVEDAVEGYKAANEYLNSFDKSAIQTASKRMIKPEFKAEYNEKSNEIRKELGLLTESEMKKECSKIKKTKYNLGLTRAKHISNDSSYKYIEKYMDELFTNKVF